MKSHSVFAALAFFGATLGVSTLAAADPIDNWGPSRIQFAAADAPFLTFASTDTVGQPGSKIDGDTNAAGDFYYNSFTMNFGDTGKAPVSGNLLAQLFLSDMSGTIDLTDPAHPYVDWTFEAKVKFKDGGTITQANCATPSFTIHVSGDPGNVDSTTFTIPNFSSPSSCASHASTIQGYFSLGTAGAKLTLYKIKLQALNGLGVPTGPLTGSP
jgi:hypothetical protein